MSSNPIIVVRSPGIPVIISQPVQVEAEIVSPGLQGPQGIDGIPGGLTERELLTIASNGQTTFSLSAVPALPHLTQLYLNGAKQALGTDYLINSSTLTWLSLVVLETADSLEIYY